MPAVRIAEPKRPVRVANCSGAACDPGVHMYNQAKYGDVDVITGDYLAEVNLANDAEAMRTSDHPGWIPTAWDGLQQTLEIANEKRIKIIINGGSLNPKGLAEKTYALVKEKGLDLTVAYVEGDNLLHRKDELVGRIKKGEFSHLDKANAHVNLADKSADFLDNPETMPVICVNAYLGYRAIKRGLDEGADIVICGRVADASPVIGAAAWWHQWDEDDYDALAHALVCGHLIECSTYITGANFAGSYKYRVEELMNLGLPIIEIDVNGEGVVTKHDALNGIVTTDTVKCQFLYELQGNTYLNSDVKADITNFKVVAEGKNRVRITGIKGYPPPPTTKLATFYLGGYQAELTINASGYATSWKWDYAEMQMRKKLEEWGVKLDVLDFQRVGVPKENPDSQLASTTYLRIFGQGKTAQDVSSIIKAWAFNGMAHFAGMHGSLDMRTAIPKQFIGFYPATIPQTELDEAVCIITAEGKASRFVVGPPKQTAGLEARANYETNSPVNLNSFGPTEMRPLGDIALGRSGDKGGNVNIGLYVQKPEQWDWFRSLMTRDKLRELMGKDWKDWYFIERVEFPDILAVHFVVYGALQKGVTSTALLDGLGKGFAEYIRAVHIPVPTKFLS
ncbi:hypothetical protein, variant [Verruconis gallopava]|uniref:DUF1446-domain-containing protein n=1 Tax=Verruconis gallopava TaxID=253628 RepID=A0A0D1ZY59_9PEZI|nr:uncharacterized protein PV09_09286 [Verruconis gallopava]XP_016208879.1 hypothetical protein, variant [Verruconis gallopava]KIV99008.1 hypothetical protein PV09_09286 [Verruconis gallopava]KIV99009.1 hypothetical protein, variant [Verruconis gallopava]